MLHKVLNNDTKGLLVLRGIRTHLYGAILGGNEKNLKTVK